MKTDYHFTRRTLPPEYRRHQAWPSISVAEMEPNLAARVTSYQSALIAYLDGAPFTLTCQELGVSKAEVLRLLNNCVSPHPDGRIYGWRALQFGTRIEKKYLRVAPAVPGPHEGGMAGAFSKLLREYPEIKQSLDILILKKPAKGVIHESRIALVHLHEEFVRLCAEAKISIHEYPFNTVHRGRRALEKYARALRSNNHFSSTARLLGGSDAAKMSQVGTGAESQLIATLPFDVCQTDGHKLDFLGSIAIPTSKGEQWVAIHSMQFVPIVDVHTSAIYGYKVVIAQQCRANDVLQAIRHALDVWQPRKLRLQGMAYPSGAGFPSSLIPELEGCCWSALMIDNASIHYSIAVRDRIRKRTGAAVNWGPVYSWPRRALIEGVFSALERAGFQRLPNTTGSSPKDPRRNDPAGKAIEYKMHWEELIDLIDIVCATYNITPRKDLGYRSPIELLRDYVYHPQSSFLPRHLPLLPPCIPNFDVVVETATVRGNVAEGRRPYVQVDGVHYTSALLSRTGSLIGTTLTLHVDEDDMRTFKAFLPGGKELGVLVALGSWGRVKHDRPTRKHIMSLVKKKRLVLQPGEEPIQAYLRAKATQALQATRGPKSKKNKVSKAATGLAHVAEMSGVPIPEVRSDGASREPHPTLSKAGTQLPGFIQRIRHRGF